MNDNEMNNKPNNNDTNASTNQPATSSENEVIETATKETNSPENNNNETLNTDTDNIGENNTNNNQEPTQENTSINQEINPTTESQEAKVEQPITTNNNQKKSNNTLMIVIIILIGFLVLAGFGSFIVFKLIIPRYQARNAAQKIIEEATGTNGDAQDIINQASDIISDGVNNMKTDEFNDELEDYVGTQEGEDVKELFDKIIMTIKKNQEHTITVAYNTISTSDTTELTNLKQQFDDSKQYEVSMDYDDNGYINAITIKEL